MNHASRKLSRSHWISGVRLELSKQRSNLRATFLVLGLSFLVVLFFVPMFTPVGFLLCLILGTGVPVLAATLAALAAGSLTSEPVTSAEQVLPLHPRARVFAAYFASLMFALLLQVLLLSLSALSLSFDWQGDLLVDVVACAASVSWWIFLVHIHGLAFALTYWMRLPFAGGALALCFAGCELFIPAAFLFAQGGGLSVSAAKTSLLFTIVVQSPEWVQAVAPTLIPAALTGIACAGGFLYLEAPRFERNMKLGIPRGVIAAAALGFSLILSIILTRA